MQFPTANKITTIKLFRYFADLPLKEAKELVERHIPSDYHNGQYDPKEVPEFVSRTLSLTPYAYSKLATAIKDHSGSIDQQTYEQRGYRILNVEPEDGDTAYVFVNLTQEDLDKTVEDLRVAKDALEYQVSDYTKINANVPTSLATSYDHVTYAYNRMRCLQLELVAKQ